MAIRAAARRVSVAITGIGVLTPLGNTPAALWRALNAGQCAVRAWDDLRDEGFRVTRAARIAGRGSDTPARALGLAVAAARAAVDDAGGVAGGRLAVVVGSTMGVSPWYEAGDGAGEGGMPDAYARAVAAALEPAAVTRATSTACAAGNYAIGIAARLVASGRVDRAVAGGVDAFSRIAQVGFSRSRAMDAERCRPFDAERGGMQLGEGAAFLLLERAADARARGARIYAHVRALGLSCDAHHATAPRPDGAGMLAAMDAALRLAGVGADAVGHISAHGTGTRASDAAEATAIAARFGGGVPVTALKGALAHSMGAAAAIEAAVAALTLHHRALPPTVGTSRLDPTLAIDLVLQPRAAPTLRFALNNAFGFGGINSSLLMEAA